MSMALCGIGVSRGFAIGKCHILQRNQLEILECAIPKPLIEDEVARFEQARASTKAHLRRVKAKIPPSAAGDIASFIDTHLLMLDDAMLSAVPIEHIRQQQCNAEWALKIQRDSLVAVFDEMEDPYLRTRKDDIDHVVTRIQRYLLDDESQGQHLPDKHLANYIILADDLTPSDTLTMQHQGIAGFVTEHGGPMSHTAILARSLGIPAVVGVRNIQRYLSDEETLIIDGQNGAVIASPDEQIQRHYRKQQRNEKRYRMELAKLKDKPALTLDGMDVSLQTNIELPEDIRSAKKVAAAGVGLYRTEFLYMNRSEPPEEEEQFQVYRKVLRKLDGIPITIRTLDLGADKQFGGVSAPEAMPVNPALGLRAIRLCLKDTRLFKPQLRAILRASAFGPMRLMIPMISNIQELMQTKQYIEQIKEELRSEGKKFDVELPLGIIIEVPASALAAHIFAKHVDFFSIGTNDLIQYTLAIDRIDDEVNYLYDPLHPSVLRLIQMTINAARRANIRVAMCGEMAGDIRYTRLLLGMGLVELSMHPAAVLEVKRAVNGTDIGALKRLTHRLLRSEHPYKTRELLDRINQLK
jgi:phosphotransferase system enzyme I (PtsI)